MKTQFKAWQAVRKRAGEERSQEWASDQLGFGQSATAQYLNGRIPLNKEAASKFGRLMGVPVASFSPTMAAEIDALVVTIRSVDEPPIHLQDGKTSTSQIESNVAPAPSLAASTWPPVVGHVRAGPDGYLEEMQYPVGHGEGYVEYWTKDTSAYALRIKGDSMHPRYRAGEYIVVTPGIEAQAGRDVVVKLKNGQALLKQLNWIRGGELQLLSINNGYAPHTISLEDVESVQRVAGSVSPDAFTNERPSQ